MDNKNDQLFRIDGLVKLDISGSCIVSDGGLFLVGSIKKGWALAKASPVTWPTEGVDRLAS